MMQKELEKFIGYEKRGETTVAVFERISNTEPGFVLNYARLSTRLYRLKKGGYPHDQTFLALNDWPSP